MVEAFELLYICRDRAGVENVFQYACTESRWISMAALAVFQSPDPRQGMMTDPTTCLERFAAKKEAEASRCKGASVCIHMGASGGRRSAWPVPLLVRLLTSPSAIAVPIGLLVLPTISLQADASVPLARVITPSVPFRLRACPSPCRSVGC